MKRSSWLVGGAAAALASCSIYGPDLVGSGGAGGSGTTSSASSSTSTSSSSTTTSSSTSTSSSSSTTTSSTGSSTSSSSSSGTPPCTSATECPGVDTECKQRTCDSGTCGFDNAQSGTVLAVQTSGDCKLAICDGNGNITSIPDNNDVADDSNECTTDACSGGSPTHTPVTAGTSCTTGGGKVCSAAGTCVECVTGGNCATGVCKNNICIAPQCNDTVKNGSETDVDCGGGMCPQCGFNKLCGSDSDCKGGSCVNSHCAATCTDGAKNGSETDVDCGGSCLTKCATGKTCSTGTDCLSGKCTGGVCTDVLLISELQTRGDATGAGGSDEFLEIYNPNAYAVVFDSAWEIWYRNANNACTAPSKKFSGAGQMIPAHGHLLYTNSMGYNGGVTGDVTYTSGFTDSGQIVLLHGGALVDSLCYYFNTTTQNNLTCTATPLPTPWFPCQGAVNNAPHNDTTNGSSNTDVSLERKPGGSLGNGQNTGDNTVDWNTMVSANPQNVASMPAP